MTRLFKTCCTAAYVMRVIDGDTWIRLRAAINGMLNYTAAQARKFRPNYQQCVSIYNKVVVGLATISDAVASVWSLHEVKKRLLCQ